VKERGWFAYSPNQPLASLLRRSIRLFPFRSHELNVVGLVRAYGGRRGRWSRHLCIHQHEILAELCHRCRRDTVGRDRVGSVALPSAHQPFRRMSDTSTSAEPFLSTGDVPTERDL
jgi:hypothetical protein